MGVSGGKAYVDERCNVREWSRLMFQMGARDAAIYVMCQQPEGADVPDCAGARDYNKEMKLLELGHNQLVEDNSDLREANNALRGEINQMVDVMAIDREAYEATIKRCQRSKKPKAKAETKAESCGQD